MANSKIWTIINHEYLKRVKSKGFIIGTLIGPLSFILFFAIIIAVSMSMGESSKKLAILDNTNILADNLIKANKDIYFKVNKSEAELSKEVLADNLDGFVVLNKEALDNAKVTVYTKGGGGLGFINQLENDLDKVLREYRMAETKVDKTLLARINLNVKLETKKINESGKTEKDNAEGMSFVGYILGFAIYILTFLYGSFVSRGVIEEKVNRIMEILASSVTPFEMMIGKVVGIGFVGLTQVAVWMVMLFGVMAVATPLVMTFDKSFNKAEIQKIEKLQQMNKMPMQSGNQAMSPQAKSFIENIPKISIWVGVAFVFYFFMGYFFYASLFAAIGSAVDTEQDAAQLQLPITLPIILTITTMPQIMGQPDSTFSIFMSLFPFSSPITMITRVAATSVPLWQIAASVIILLTSTVGAIWFAAKIYRVGILMTGKKPTFKDLLKWAKSN